ncbi:MAG: c-type cytochrome [Gemmatimonadetes bacterium]|nr:c-type cytochrome [Gemmatimonadota bacterium]
MAAAPSPSPATPTRVRGNAPVGATVGLPFVHDITQGGATFSGGQEPVTYRATFLPGANGLSLVGNRLVGTPLAAGQLRAVVQLRDAAGRTAADTITVVAFDAGLTEPSLPAAAYAYSDARVPLPAHIRGAAPGVPAGVVAGDNTPAGNLITDAGATLGRVLFHDRRLSANDRVSCASCHQQRFGFSDTARLSRGFAGAPTARHSMALANARIYPNGRFFWDERAPTLEAQVLLPIQDAGEMGMTLDGLLTKLRLTPYYAPLFAAAFGSNEITADRVSRALAQFVRALVPTASRFDQAFAGGGAPNFAAVFTPEEQLGEQLFRGRAGCARCHGQATQVAVAAVNNGLDAAPADAGAGQGRFKVPSLRNVAIRAPYMHDGRFRTLEEVVAFYDSGVQAGAGTDPRLLQGPGGTPIRLGLSAAERAALVAFLRTLTDDTFLADPRLADPFAGR